MIGPLAYIGGKNRIADKIIALFPPHTTYVEPFAGGAQVFFHKKPSKVEILNDLDGEIVNFFRVCQNHHQELIRYLRFMIVSRKWYELLSAGEPTGLTDIHRAGRFLYLQKNSFGGRVVRQSYAQHITQTPPFNPARIPELIDEAHDRLQRVQIESLPYEELLKKCDRPSTLFYLDPPYWGRALYRFNLQAKDFEGLAERLKTITGKFVLSLNDVPEVRALYCDFNVEEIALAYSAQKKAGQRYRELLIKNF
jgi:DNA adenine methylase